jgi:hypothetical protein
MTHHKFEYRYTFCSDDVGTVLIASLVSLSCYHLSFYFNDERKREQSIDKQALIRESFQKHMLERSASRDSGDDDNVSRASSL